VADYPFTTRLPVPGMMPFEDVQIQLLDLPPLSAEFMEPWLPQVIRAATMNVLVIDLNDPAVLDEIEFLQGAYERYRLAPPRLLVGNKLDLPGGPGNFAALQDLYGPRYRYLGISALTGHNLDAFIRAMFDLLEIVRVYTKVPGKKADLAAPYILKRGGTVIDAARHVHKDFAENLKFARLFNTAGEGGLAVERDHVLRDRDVLEFHI